MALVDDLQSRYHALRQLKNELLEADTDLHEQLRNTNAQMLRVHSITRTVETWLSEVGKSLEAAGVPVVEHAVEMPKTSDQYGEVVKQTNTVSRGAW